MEVNSIITCYVGPEISPEQFISEHFFLYLIKGKIEGYDGYKHYTLKAGEYCLVRKNNLARYNKQKEDNQFEKVVFAFDEVFLRSFYQKYPFPAVDFNSDDVFFTIKKNDLVPSFLRSISAYNDHDGKIDKTFEDIKREELLLILLKINPELSSILFDFRSPGKVDLEAFMNKNFKFNVALNRFAFLTGRSLSGFKRDFEKIFRETPSRWLIQKRLKEAYFLIEKKNKKPSDIYLELGFEDLSHFSFAFKKLFGKAPSELYERTANFGQTHQQK